MGRRKSDCRGLLIPKSVRVPLADLLWLQSHLPGFNFGEWVRKKMMDERLSRNDSTASFVRANVTPTSKEAVYEKDSGGVGGVSRIVHSKPYIGSESQVSGAKDERKVKCVEVHDATFRFESQTRMMHPPDFWKNPHHLNHCNKRTTWRISGVIKHHVWLVPYGESFVPSDAKTGVEGEVYVETTSKAKADLGAGTTIMLVVSTQEERGTEPNDLAKRTNQRKEQAWAWLVENWGFLATPAEDCALAKFSAKGHPMADLAAKAGIVIHPPRGGGFGTDSTPDGPTIHSGGNLQEAAKAMEHFLRGTEINGEALKHIEERIDHLEVKILDRLRVLDQYVPATKLGVDGYG